MLDAHKEGTLGKEEIHLVYIDKFRSRIGVQWGCES